MKITKFGHCCLLIETNGKKILTDPGSYTTEQDSVTGIDIVVISHEHGDHFHIESVKKVLANNPNAAIITNAAVGAKLAAEGIAHTVLDGAQSAEIAGIHLEAFDAKHEEIFEEIGQVQNTAYFIGELFYPGDAFAHPGKPVQILALPVAGPWCKFADAMRYAIKMQPKKAFPVHDAVLAGGGIFVHQMAGQILNGKGIEFVGMAAGDTKDF